MSDSFASQDAISVTRMLHSFTQVHEHGCQAASDVSTK